MIGRVICSGAAPLEVEPAAILRADVQHHAARPPRVAALEELLGRGKGLEPGAPQPRGAPVTIAASRGCRRPRRRSAGRQKNLRNASRPPAAALIPTTAMNASRPRRADAILATARAFRVEGRAPRVGPPIFLARSRLRASRLISSASRVACGRASSCSTLSHEGIPWDVLKRRTRVHARRNPGFVSGESRPTGRRACEESVEPCT